MNAHVSLAFKTDQDTELINRAVAVYAGLEANATTFPTPPFMLPLLMSSKGDFETKVAAAHKGSVAQTEAKRAARGVLTGYLAQLAAYVEGIAQGNADTIRSAGFDVVTHDHGPQVPLAKPIIDGAKNFAATQIQLHLKAQPNVHGVRVQCRSAGGTWSDGGGFPSTKLVIVNNLTPGTLYDFRVQYIGGSTGTSEWSDVLSHICT